MPLGAFRLNGISRYLAPTGSRTAVTVTPTADAKIITAQSKFGGASALFDGSNDRLTAANNNLLYWNTQPYTVEYWCRITALTSQTNDDPTIIGNMNPGGQQDYWSFGPDNSGNLTFKYYNGASITVKDTGTMSLDTWYHCAAVIYNNTITIYLDGVNKGSASISGTPQFDTGYGGLNIGWGNITQSYNGYLDEVRISDVPRYLAAFTPSTTAFVNDDTTQLLLHMDGANNSTTFTDDTTQLSAVTDVYIAGQVTSTSSSITIPSTAKAGDIALLFDTSTTVTDTTPSGWTSINGVTTTGIRTNISRKTLVSGDIGASVTGMAGTTRKVLLLFRPNGPVTTITVSTPLSQATTLAPNSQSVNAGAAPSTTPVISFWCAGSTGSPTLTSTGTTQVTSISTSGVRVAYRQWNSGQTPANQSGSTTDTGTNTFQSFFIRFA
jgi:hypothetical protein